MLERAARDRKAAPALGLGSSLGQPPDPKAVRGAARPWRGRGVVGRREQIFPRAHQRSAPRTLTAQRISSERMRVEWERAA